MELLCCPWFSGLCACFLCSLSLSLSLSGALSCPLCALCLPILCLQHLRKTWRNLIATMFVEGLLHPGLIRFRILNPWKSVKRFLQKPAGFQWVWWGWPDLGWARLGWPGPGPKCCRFGIFEFMPKSNFSMAKGVVAHGLSLCLCGPGRSFDGFSTSTFLGEEISEALVWGRPTLSQHLSSGGGTPICAV